MNLRHQKQRGYLPTSFSNAFTAVVAQATPKRSVVILPGLGNNRNDYNIMQQQLEDDYGFCVETADVSRVDWGRNARGLLDRNYWRGSLNPRPTVDWYLHKTAQAIEKVQELNPDGPITLLAHSAGGWLGRLYLLEFGTTGIDRFVSLGSPHLPPPQGVIDQTRGILTWITERSPGAYHADDLEYVTIAGKFIKGSPLLGPGDFYSRVIGLGYNQVCGESAVWGDGVVPIPSAHLEGAMQLTLDGIYHSPLGASLDVEENVILTAAESSYVDSDDYDDLPGQEVSADEPATTPAARKWYGSKSVVPQWVHLLRVSAAPSNKNVLKRDV